MAEPGLFHGGTAMPNHVNHVNHESSTDSNTNAATMGMSMMIYLGMRRCMDLYIPNAVTQILQTRQTLISGADRPNAACLAVCQTVQTDYTGLYERPLAHCLPIHPIALKILIMAPSVAIAGAAGHLGQYITAAFLSPPFQDAFSRIILLSRQEHGASSPLAQYKSHEKVVFRQYDENNPGSALDGVQVLVNTIGASGHDFKEKLLRAIPGSDVRLYFPSEFGVDHYIHDFPHGEWDRKKKHDALAREIIPSVKICRVFCGLFLEDSIGPWFGLDTKHGKYESVGPASSPVSFTALGDVGRVVAQLASRPVDQIPETVHIGGDTKSVADIAKIMEQAGAGGIRVKEVDIQEYKSGAMNFTTSTDPAMFLRFLMGERKIQHTEEGVGNDNESVNPGEKVWKWKTVEDLAKETKGRPWSDFDWFGDCCNC